MIFKGSRGSNKKSEKQQRNQPDAVSSKNSLIISTRVRFRRFVLLISFQIFMMRVSLIAMLIAAASEYTNDRTWA